VRIKRSYFGLRLKVATGAAILLTAGAICSELLLPFLRGVWESEQVATWPDPGPRKLAAPRVLSPGPSVGPAIGLAAAGPGGMVRRSRGPVRGRGRVVGMDGMVVFRSGQQNDPEPEETEIWSCETWE
jgi:hypothetical protein